MANIKKILPTDVLAESMNKINDNFEALANASGISSSLISKYRNEITNMIETFKSEFHVTDSEVYAMVERLQEGLDKTIRDVSTFQILADQILARVERIETNSSGDVEKLSSEIRQLADKIEAYVNGAIGDIDLSSQLEMFVRHYRLGELEDLYESVARIKSELEKDGSDGDYEHLLAELELLSQRCDSFSRSIARLSALIESSDSDGHYNILSELELLSQRCDGFKEAIARLFALIESSDSDDYHSIRAQLELLSIEDGSLWEAIARLQALIESSDSDGYHSIIAQLELLSREDSDIWEAIGRLKAEIESSDSDGYNKLLSMLELYVKKSDVDGLEEAIAKLKALIEGSDSDGYYNILSQLDLLTQRCDEFDLSLADLLALIEGSDSDSYYSILARLRLLSKQYDDIQEALAELKAIIEGSDSDGYSKLLAQLELYVRNEMEGYKEALAKLTALIESSDSDGYYSILSRLNLLSKDTKTFREALADLQAKIEGSDSDSYYSMLAELELYVHDELGGVKEAQATMKSSIDNHEAAISTMVTKDANGYITSEVKLKGDQIVVEGDNFKVDSAGNVSVTGDITATSLTLIGDAKQTILDIIGDGDITVNARHIAGIDVEYIWWDSSTTAPSQTESGWSTTAGTAPEGKQYLWSRTKTTYSLPADGETDNLPSYSTPYWIKMGEDGTDGTNGRGIVSIEELYAQTSSPTTVPADSAFSTTAPTWESGMYIWTRTRIVYTEGEPTLTTPICVTGSIGPSGYSVTGIEEEFANYSSNTQIPGDTEWKSSAGATPEKGMYFWRRWRTILSDGSTIPSIGWNYECVSYIGDDGQSLYTWIKYSDKDDETRTSSDLYDDPEGMSYIGFAYNKDKDEESDTNSNDPSVYDWMKFRGNDGNSVEAEYSADLLDWHTDFETGDIWMHTRKTGYTWSSPTRIVGEKGDTGTYGPYMDYTFNVSKNNTSSSVTTPPDNLKSSTWSDNPVATDDTYKYLWMKVQKMVGNNNNTGWVASGNASYACLTGPQGMPGEIDDTTMRALESLTGWDPDGYIKSADLSITQSDVIYGGQTYKVNTIEFNNKTYKVLEDNEKGIVFTDVGFGQDANVDDANANNHNFTMISSDGLLQANNAIIYGTVYANGGQIGGINIQDSGLSARNFSLTSDGTLTATGADITGDITANKLVIKNGSGTKEITDYSDFDITSYDDDWIKEAFEETTIDGGIILSGNIFVADGEGNINAGISGTDTDENDVRFFAGNSDLNNAPFRVYEDGTLYAKEGIFAGYTQMRYTPLSQLHYDAKWVKDSTLGINSTNDTLSKLGLNKFIEGNGISTSVRPVASQKYWDYVYYDKTNYNYYKCTSSGSGYTWSLLTCVDNGQSTESLKAIRHETYFEDTAYEKKCPVKVAGDNAYILINSSDLSGGIPPVLVIPNATSSLNGFTYHIIVTPSEQSFLTRGNKIWGVIIRCSGDLSSSSTNQFRNFALSGTAHSTCSQIKVAGGHLELVCTGDEWAITQCTGEIDIMSWQNTSTAGYSPIYGYTSTDEFDEYANRELITKIAVGEGIGTVSRKYTDTIYIDTTTSS